MIQFDFRFKDLILIKSIFCDHSESSLSSESNALLISSEVSASWVVDSSSLLAETSMGKSV
jgi:hypothetical protein